MTTCGKCQTNFGNENSICCDLCDQWFHLRCSNITLKIFKSVFVGTDSVWFCKSCLDSIFPFSSLSQNKFSTLYQTKLESEILRIKSSDVFSEVCPVCTKNVQERHKFIPCSSCKCLIHTNCSNKADLTLSSHDVCTWICPLCIKEVFPFMELNDFEFGKQQSCSTNTAMSKACIDHLNKTSEFYNLMENEYEISTVNCNYYDQNEFTKLIHQQISKDNFSVFHTNISSIQGNFDKLELLINQLGDTFSFDIISLTETWNPSSKNHLFNPKNLSGYQKYIGQSGTSLKSGCGFYISNDINYIPRKDLDTHFYNQTNEYSCKWIEVINKNKSNIVVASIYRHPSKNDTSFLEYINSSLLRLSKEGKYIMITGDFNYNLLKYDKDEHTKEFLGIMLSHFCQPHIIFPTRVVDNAMPSLIDNIFLNSIENNPISGNLTCKITDHMPNFLICQKFDKNSKKFSIKKRDFSNFTKEKFLADMSELGLSDKIKVLLIQMINLIY